VGPGGHDAAAGGAHPVRRRGASLRRGLTGLALCAGLFSVAHAHTGAMAHGAGVGEQGQAAPQVEMPLMGGVRQFDAPEPGSYRLPPIRKAADGEVMRSDGTAARLHDVYDGRLVVLSFIFTTCTDAKGCPLATGVMHRIHRQLQTDPALRDHLRLVTLSFDHAHDTPEVMAEYAQGVARGGEDWLFLTTRSARALKPILQAYDQNVLPEYDASGEPTGGFSHVLRVYLIDRDKRVRNIYSSSYLYHDLVLADIKTLLLEERAGASEARVP
jgi:cytochrome c peroxidase